MEYTRRRNIYKGRVVELVLDTVTLPNGHEVELELVLHPGAAVVVPLIRPGVLLMVRQYRYAAQDWLYEVPAGKLSRDEDPAVCAARELTEETGFRARSLRKLTEFWSTPGILREKMHLFLAEDLSPGRQNLEHDEVLEATEVTLTDALEMVRDGRISDAKTIVGILYFATFVPSPSRGEEEVRGNGFVRRMSVPPPGSSPLKGEGV